MFVILFKVSTFAVLEYRYSEYRSTVVLKWLQSRGEANKGSQQESGGIGSPGTGTRVRRSPLWEGNIGKLILERTHLTAPWYPNKQGYHGLP